MGNIIGYIKQQLQFLFQTFCGGVKILSAAEARGETIECKKISSNVELMSIGEVILAALKLNQTYFFMPPSYIIEDKIKQELVELGYIVNIVDLGGSNRVRISWEKDD